MKRAIVLALDGLGTIGLGPYGNASVMTPAINRLASQSFLAEHVLIDAPHLDLLYNAMLKGGHGAFPASCFWNQPSIMELLRENHRSSTIICDARTIRQASLLESFDHQIIVDVDDATELAAQPEETWMANFFSDAMEAIGAIDSVKESDLIWIHCSALTRAWDAPYDFRCQFVDEGDPDPPTCHLPPSAILDRDNDPDWLHGIQCAYHAQIMLLDLMFDAFTQDVEDIDSCLLIVVGNRGFPLGERQIVGFPENRLFTNLLQVPLIVRFPGSRAESTRYQGLVQFGDMFASLSNWFEIPTPTAQTLDFAAARHNLNLQYRSMAICADNDSTAIRTNYWFAIHQTRHGKPDTVALYVKPDDRWDFNNVAELCPDIVADVIDFVPVARSNLNSGKIADIPESLLWQHK